MTARAAIKDPALRCTPVNSGVSWIGSASRRVSWAHFTGMSAAGKLAEVHEITIKVDTRNFGKMLDADAFR